MRTRSVVCRLECEREQEGVDGEAQGGGRRHGMAMCASLLRADVRSGQTVAIVGMESGAVLLFAIPAAPSSSPLLLLLPLCRSAACVLPAASQAAQSASAPHRLSLPSALARRCAADASSVLLLASSVLSLASCLCGVGSLPQLSDSCTARVLFVASSPAACLHAFYLHCGRQLRRLRLSGASLPVPLRHDVRGAAEDGGDAAADSPGVGGANAVQWRADGSLACDGRLGPQAALPVSHAAAAGEPRSRRRRRGQRAGGHAARARPALRPPLPHSSRRLSRLHARREGKRRRGRRRRRVGLVDRRLPASRLRKRAGWLLPYGSDAASVPAAVAATDVAARDRRRGRSHRSLAHLTAALTLYIQHSCGHRAQRLSPPARRH